MFDTSYSKLIAKALNRKMDRYYATAKGVDKSEHNRKTD